VHPTDLPARKSRTSQSGVRDALKDEHGAVMRVARMAALVVGLVFVSAGSIPAEVQQPKRGITLEDYMRMDRHGQTMYMVGLIEGFMTEATLARVATAKNQGRPDGEVEAELSPVDGTITGQFSPT
jgi:hypothetical protein